MLAVLASALLFGSSGPDPLAPSRNGYMGCIEPDQVHKTCLSLKHYVWSGPQVSVRGDTLINGLPLTAVTTLDHVTYVGDAVCSWTKAEDIEAGILAITVDGQPLHGEAFRNRRDELLAPILATAGQEYCVTFETAPTGGFVMQVSLDGVRRPEFDRTLLWVRSEDGWRLGL